MTKLSEISNDSLLALLETKLRNDDLEEDATVSEVRVRVGAEAILKHSKAKQEFEGADGKGSEVRSPYEEEIPLIYFLHDELRALVKKEKESS